MYGIAKLSYADFRVATYTEFEALWQAFAGPFESLCLIRPSTIWAMAQTTDGEQWDACRHKLQDAIDEASYSRNWPGSFSAHQERDEAGNLIESRVVVWPWVNDRSFGLCINHATGECTVTCDYTERPSLQAASMVIVHIAQGKIPSDVMWVKTKEQENE